MVLAYIDELDEMISSLQKKFIVKRDDQEFIDQLNRLKDDTLRLLREKALTLGEI
jgi:hypothetical protein